MPKLGNAGDIVHLWIELAGDGPGSLPRRYQTHETYIPTYYDGLCCYSDVFCHDLGSDGDVARVWIRDHAIDPEVLHIGRKRSVDPRDARSDVLGIVLGL